MAQPTYGTRQTLTITLASLASSADWTAGRESNEVDNSVTLWNDVILQGFVTVGTTPTTGTAILVYAWGSDQAAATANLDAIDGVDSAETITSTAVRDGLLKLVARLDVNATTSDRRYLMGAVGLAQLFGGSMPRHWGLFVTHNTGVALNATGGNHEFSWRGVSY
jgi:hypothetical protein